MKLRNHSSCDGCRGLCAGNSGSPDRCTLGYRQRSFAVTVLGIPLQLPIPAEPCPKPRTLRQFVTATRKAGAR